MVLDPNMYMDLSYIHGYASFYHFQSRRDLSDRFPVLQTQQAGQQLQFSGPMEFHMGHDPNTTVLLRAYQSVDN